MSMRRLVPVLLLLALLPAAVEAQRRPPRRVVDRFVERDYNRFSLEPYAGAFKDAYDISDATTGYIFGLRLGYELGARGRIIGHAGYSETDDVATPGTTADHFLYDNQWIFTTAGGEYDVIPGRTSASLGVQAGAAWRKVSVGGRIGTPDPGSDVSDDAYSSYEVIVPGITLRHRFTPRAGVTLSFEDYIFDVFEGTADHSPALTLGVRFR